LLAEQVVARQTRQRAVDHGGQRLEGRVALGWRGVFVSHNRQLLSAHHRVTRNAHGSSGPGASPRRARSWVVQCLIVRVTWWVVASTVRWGSSGRRVFGYFPRASRWPSTFRFQWIFTRPA